jgi:hypothetical protein
VPLRPLYVSRGRHWLCRRATRRAGTSVARSLFGLTGKNVRSRRAQRQLRLRHWRHAEVTSIAAICRADTTIHKEFAPCAGRNPTTGPARTRVAQWRSSSMTWRRTPRSSSARRPTATFAFAHCIDDLVDDEDCDILVDDIGYFGDYGLPGRSHCASARCRRRRQGVSRTSPPPATTRATRGRARFSARQFTIDLGGIEELIDNDGSYTESDERDICSRCTHKHRHED